MREISLVAFLFSFGFWTRLLLRQITQPLTTTETAKIELCIFLKLLQQYVQGIVMVRKTGFFMSCLLLLINSGSSVEREWEKKKFLHEQGKFSFFLCVRRLCSSIKRENVENGSKFSSFFLQLSFLLLSILSKEDEKKKKKICSDSYTTWISQMNPRSTFNGGRRRSKRDRRQKNIYL